MNKSYRDHDTASKNNFLLCCSGTGTETLRVTPLGLFARILYAVDKVMVTMEDHFPCYGVG